MGRLYNLERVTYAYNRTVTMETKGNNYACGQRRNPDTPSVTHTGGNNAHPRRRRISKSLLQAQVRVQTSRIRPQLKIPRSATASVPANCEAAGADHHANQIVVNQTMATAETKPAT